MDKTTLSRLILILSTSNLGPMVARVGDLPSQRVVDVLNTFCQNKIEPFIQANHMMNSLIISSVTKRHW